MAYDRYVAICNPLLYPVVMSNRLCTHLKSISYAIGFLHPLIHVSLLLRLTFCGSKIIHYFYCEILQLFKISCNDPPVKALMITTSAAFIQISTLMTMIISYSCVSLTFWKKSLKRAEAKPSPCAVPICSLSHCTMACSSSGMCALHRA